MAEFEPHLDLTWDDGSRVSVPLGAAEGFVWRCPTCDHATVTRIVVLVPEGFDPRRVLAESLAGRSLLVQHIVSTCPRRGWTNDMVSAEEAT